MYYNSNNDNDNDDSDDSDNDDYDDSDDDTCNCPSNKIDDVRQYPQVNQIRDCFYLFAS